MNGFDISESLSITKGSVEIDALYLGSELIWPKHFEEMYLTFQATEDNTSIGFICNSSDHTYYNPKTIYVSTDKVNWLAKTPVYNQLDPIFGTGYIVQLATLNKNEKLYVKGYNSAYTTVSNNEISNNSFDYRGGKIKVYGNIMSLIDGDNFNELFTLTAPYTFYSLFNVNGSDVIIGSIKEFHNVILPATTLTPHCYEAMFHGHSNSSSYTDFEGTQRTPVLPATILAEYCYKDMFRDCISICLAPDLPATVLQPNCYENMFYDCTSLKSMPNINATTLAQYCCKGMFYNCAALNIISELHATTLANYCYYEMFMYCSQLTDAPELRATSLRTCCYERMFANCTRLEHIAMFGIPSGNSSFVDDDWVYNVAPTGTFIKNPDWTNYTMGDDSIPIGWLIYDASLHSISINASHGTVTTNLSHAFEGETIIITSTPDSGYELSSMTVTAGGQPIVVTNNTFIMPDADVTINATFTALTYTITIASANHGYITSQQTATTDSTVTITDYPDTGYYLYNSLVEYGQGQGFYVLGNTFTMPPADITITPQFVMINYNISITSSSLGTVKCYRYWEDSIGQSGWQEVSTAHYGDSMKFTLIPDSHCDVQSYSIMTGSTHVPVTQNPQNPTEYFFTMPAGDIAINAVFDWIYYDINITQVSGGHMTADKQTAHYNELITLTPVPNTYEEFNSVTVIDDDTQSSVSVNNNTFYMPDSDVTVEGDFTNYEGEYLTFTTPEGSTDSVGIYFLESSNNNDPRTISVSYDKVNWTSYTSSVAGTHIGTVQRGAYSQGVSIEKLYVKATQTAAYYKSGTSYSYFGTNPNSGAYDINYFIVTGNIMSLLYGDNFTNQTSTQYNYMFGNLFRNATYLKDATHLVLPATTLTQYCYFCMFYGCNMLGSNIVGVVRGNIPKLLATTLATSCYQGMFGNCTWLRTVPSNLLPATTLAASCYYSMFNGCSSLTTAPSILPATTLAQDCYREMFKGCTALTAAPALTATNLTGAYRCYRDMFYGCTSLTTAPALPATTLAEYCYQSMFQGCTSLTTAPALPATTLTQYCYQSMFQGCTSLVNTMTLPAATLKAYCYQNMFANCGSGLKLPDITAVTRSTGWGPCRQMFANSAITDARYNYKGNPFMPSNISSYSEGSTFEAAFSGCTSLLYAPDITCTYTFHGVYNIMFKGCTALTAAPQLAPTTLANYCYQGMFQGCTSLSNVTCLATNISGTDCTKDWLTNVSASGTFTKASSTTWSTGSSGIPSGWTVVNAS